MVALTAGQGQQLVLHLMDNLLVVLLSKLTRVTDVIILKVYRESCPSLGLYVTVCLPYLGTSQFKFFLYRAAETVFFNTS